MAPLLDISHWGPATWKSLHAISYAYPDTPTEDQKEEMFAYLHALAAVLPCAKCGRHFKQKLLLLVDTKESPVLASKKAFARFLVDVHNEVNVTKGTKTWTYAEVDRLYVGGAHHTQDLGFCVVVFASVMASLFWISKHTGKHAEKKSEYSL